MLCTTGSLGHRAVRGPSAGLSAARSLGGGASLRDALKARSCKIRLLATLKRTGRLVLVQVDVVEKANQIISFIPLLDAVARSGGQCCMGTIESLQH